MESTNIYIVKILWIAGYKINDTMHTRCKFATLFSLKQSFVWKINSVDVSATNKNNLSN